MFQGREAPISPPPHSTPQRRTNPCWLIVLPGPNWDMESRCPNSGLGSASWSTLHWGCFDRVLHILLSLQLTQQNGVLPQDPLSLSEPDHLVVFSLFLPHRKERRFHDLTLTFYINSWCGDGGKHISRKCDCFLQANLQKPSDLGLGVHPK